MIRHCIAFVVPLALCLPGCCTAGRKEPLTIQVVDASTSIPLNSASVHVSIHQVLHFCPGNEEDGLTGPDGFVTLHYYPSKNTGIAVDLKGYEHFLVTVDGDQFQIWYPRSETGSWKPNTVLELRLTRTPTYSNQDP